MGPVFPPEVKMGANARLSPRARLALRALVGAALLVFVVSRAELAELRLPGGVALLGGLAAAVLLLAGVLIMSAVRWWLVLGPGVVPLGWLVYLYFVSQFFSLFLPTSVGGDAVRVVSLSQAVGSTGRALSSVMIERMLGLGALMTYLVLGSLMAPALLLSPLERLSWTVGWREALGIVIAAGLAVGLLAAFGERSAMLRQLVHDATEVWRRLRASPLRLATVVAASFVVQMGYVLVWYVLALVFDFGIPLRALLVFVPFVSLATMLPVTLSGLGVREGAWALLLQPLGVSSANAIAFSLLFYVATVLTGVLGGGVYMARGLDVGRVRDRSAPHPVQATRAHEAAT